MNQQRSTAETAPAGSDQCPITPDESLARGLIYRLIAAAFRYPGADTLEAIREQAGAMTEALAALGESTDGRLADYAIQLRDKADRTTPDVLERNYVSIFSHAVRGRCPLYETEYGENDQRLQLPHELSDLSAFYRAFGLQLGSGVQERVDFAAVECEFMAFLCVKQAYAEEHGDAELAAITVDAQQKFLHDHLGRWLPACARRIIDQTDDPFYGPLGRLVLAFVTDDCRRLDVTPGNEHLRLRLPLKDEDACVSCPMAEAAAGTDLAATVPLKG